MLSFVREKINIFYINKFIDLKRLCISQLIVKEIFDIVHNEDHSNFEKCYEIILKS